MCDLDFSGIGYCTAHDTFAPNCPIVNAYSNRECEKADGYWL